MDSDFLYPLSSNDEFHAGVSKDSCYIAFATASTILGNDTRRNTGHSGDGFKRRYD